MKSIVQTLFVLALSFISILSYAVTVENLSDVDIAVKNQSLSERKVAIHKGIRQVIFKYVGDETVFDNPRITNALSHPSDLMNQYSYFQDEGNLYLKVQFSKAKVIELLRKAQVPIWGKSRPLTIAWISFDDGTSSYIESDTSNSDFINSFKAESEKVALPVVLPIMDFDEATSVTISDIKGSFVNQFHSLNQRYDVEYYTLLTITKVNDFYRFQLKLYPQEQEGILRPIYEYKGQTQEVETLVAEIFKLLAGYFSKEYSVIASSENSNMILQFVNVDSLAKAIEIERYMNSLTTVKSAYIKSIQNNTLSIALDLYGNDADMLKLLKLDQKIKAVDTENLNESLIIQRYTWQ